MDLILARHAETVFNAAARMQGNMAHTPLTRAGIAQAGS
jgi:broad specificity phosphatase PhoE